VKGPLYVVRSERQAERLAREGLTAKTRAALIRALLEALAPDVGLAPAETTRLALEFVLLRVAPKDALLAPLARAAGPAWARTVDAIDAAIGALRAAGVDEARLAAALGGRLEPTSAARARTLRAAMVALDAELARVALLDARAAASAAARAVAGANADDVGRVVGASRVVARGILAWDLADVSFWRALDGALARCGGGAQVELGAFEQRLDPSRERGALEIVADELARALDEAPLLVQIATPIALDTFDPARVEVRPAANAAAQASAVADAVHAAAAAGTPIDRVAVALPRIDDEVLEPVRAALAEAGIAAHEPRGRAPITSGIVAVALEALALAGRGLPRRDVATLLKSRYLDAQTLTGVDGRREAASRLLDLARALEQTPTVRDPDPRAQLAATARAYRERAGDPDPDAEARAALAARVAGLLVAPSNAQTHTEHVEAARVLFAALGLGPRMGAGARTALARDEPARGVPRAELAALAADTHAWEVLASALDSYEAAAARLGVSNVTGAGDAFRHHLLRVLEVGAPPLGAARTAAVRIARLEDLAGDALDLLVVVDANEGVLPAAAAGDPLVPEELARALGVASPALRRARELGALDMAASCASRVVLAYRLRDEQGGAMAPAPIVGQLERAGAPVRIFRASPLVERPLSLADARLAWLAAAPAHAERLAPDAARRASVERRREAFFYDPARTLDEIVGQVRPDESLAAALAEETGAARPLAVTSLERAARCPFQGFASIVLGARDLAQRGELPDAREQGSLVHEALAAAFRATTELWTARPRDAARIESRAMAAAEEVLAREALGSPLREVVLARARDDVRAVVAFGLRDESWDFALAEQAFGEEGGWPALRVEADGEALVLRGKIDRLDFGPSAVRAIDYKASKRTADASTRDLGATTYQTLVYGIVAARATGRARARGLYLPTPARELGDRSTVREPDAERWAELLADAPRRAIGVVGGLRKGALAPIPEDKHACNRCHVRGGCRMPRFAVAPDDETNG
jgi:ATP-dependent helicase/nuclease subunit B